jgi:biotin-dependent carboxylase-like uncharacterized protein
MIVVTAAPPFATIQDLGRVGFRDSGVPVSGVADRESALALNAMLGNDPNAAMIEWALAGGALQFDHACTVAIGGAEVACAINGRAVHPFTPFEASAGSQLVVSGIIRGRFLLVAVSGGIDAPVVLGSRSTLISASIGGLDGRRLKTRDVLLVGNARASSAQPARPIANPGRRLASTGAIHVMRGPQADMFDERAWTTFLNADLVVSRASDRTGYRLEGVEIQHSGGAALPSEPTCLGAIQVPNGGAPIVIMNDGPTIGGYPKIAVIRAAYFSRFAQLAPGDRVRFALDETPN